MAQTLASVASTVKALASGETYSFPHGLQDEEGRGLIPDVVLPVSNTPLRVTAVGAVNLTAVNDGPTAVVGAFYCLALWSPQRAALSLARGNVVPSATSDSGSGLFGDGSDGDVTIPAGSTTALIRDMFYNTLTVEGRLVTASSRVFARTLIFSGGGVLAEDRTIAMPANSGSNGSGVAGGAGGLASVGGLLAQTLVGGNGGIAGAGAAGTATGAANPALGGAGGLGGTSGGAQGGGIGGAITGPLSTALRDTSSVFEYMSSPLLRGGGGGGGGGGDAADGGGGGGAGGGLVLVVAREIRMTASGGIHAPGGAGGAGFVAAGGGAGGGGGAAIVLRRQQTGTGTLTVSALGGAGGSGPGAGTDGNPGSVGTARSLYI